MERGVCAVFCAGVCLVGVGKRAEILYAKYPGKAWQLLSAREVQSRPNRHGHSCAWVRTTQRGVNVLGEETLGFPLPAAESEPEQELQAVRKTCLAAECKIRTKQGY